MVSDVVEGWQVLQDVRERWQGGLGRGEFLIVKGFPFGGVFRLPEMSTVGEG